MQDSAVISVKEAIKSGELGQQDLSARRITAFLGKTTSVLYHHYGSVDGFLYRVGQAGFAELAEQMFVDDKTSAAENLEHMAMEYLAYALRYPVLYDLMIQRRWDWEALWTTGLVQGSPGMLAWNEVVGWFTELGGDDPDSDARLFLTALHGMVALTLSGRMNMGRFRDDELEVAQRTARRMVSRLIVPL